MKPHANKLLTAAIVLGLTLSIFSVAGVTKATNTNGLEAANRPLPDINIDDCFTILGSNSTISDLAFNQTEAEFTFTVTGASGTTGYVWCKIAEDLIPHEDTSKKVQVLLDQDTIEYMYTFDDGAWELYFEYNHSSHEVVISVPKQTPTFLGFDLVNWVVILAVSVTVGVVTVWWNRKQKINRAGA